MNDLAALRRAAVAGVVLALVIGVTSSFAFIAAYRFDPEALLADPGSIVDGGPATAALFRWGAIGDMLYSYLLLVPLALYLHLRLRPRKPWLADLGIIGAFAYIFVGAAGAAILAAAGPPLIEAYPAVGPPDRVVISTSFHLLTNAVFFGLWQTVDPIPLGTWLLSVGWLMREERRAVGRLLIVLGVSLIVAIARTTLGLHSVSVLVAGTALALLVWAAWVVVDRVGQRNRSTSHGDDADSGWP